MAAQIAASAGRRRTNSPQGLCKWVRGTRQSRSCRGEEVTEEATK